MIIVDGKKIANELKEELKQQVTAVSARLQRKPALAIVLVGDDKASRAFTSLKQKFGEYIGMEVRLWEFPGDISTEKLRKEISEKIVHNNQKQYDGVIIQLPLPQQINKSILNVITLDLDVDILSSRAMGDFVNGKGKKLLPPVVGAVTTIFEYPEYRAHVPEDLHGVEVVVVGEGILVGWPVSQWFMQQGATVTVVNEHTPDIAEFTLRADIVVSGAGEAGIITGDMIQKGAIVIDAGTSEAKNGKLAGDVDTNSVAEKASLLVPVPGGVGPLTVAYVFKNLLELLKS
jgi:methylenetetrahydrofolate dehydrogenase (NADP+) / methenyltetrahydrofolate cyclohydrolase